MYLARPISRAFGQSALSNMVSPPDLMRSVKKRVRVQLTSHGVKFNPAMIHIRLKSLWLPLCVKYNSLATRLLIVAA